MKRVVVLLGAVLLVSLLSACGSQPAQSVYSVPKPISSQQCFITQAESQIWLEREEEWNELPDNSKQQLSVAGIDFRNSNVLIISTGQKSTSGYALELTNWLLEQDHWQVTRIVRSPSVTSMKAQVITSPCLLVKIPKSIKSITINNEQGQPLGRWPF